ncbi:MAG TPA: hypothetical protein H9761_05900 [Candidatus Eisenbergiella merdavium]|uniref:Uncharacterized protein n=1 Tax=Candidatus Eisenbergiella merdavium TaxID=2838551 RepID=A0A9D2SQ90_9FIRM|nr:hypothetical protein [Candidatus Eisenbergiella merdavium]
MKEKDKILLKDTKKTCLVGGAIAAVILIIVLCILIWHRSSSSLQDLSSLIMDELSASDLDYLPAETSQLEKIADTTADVLNRLSASGTERESMIQALTDSLLEMNLGLSEAEAQDLASWLVDLYLDQQNITENTGLTAKPDSALLEQLTSDLQNMADYLERLDTSIVQNREELLNLSGSQNETSNTIQKYLQNLETTVSELHQKFSSYETDSTIGESINETVNTGISNISSLLGTLYESIANSQNEILVELANSELNDNEKYEVINSRLGELNVSLNQTLSEIDEHLSRVLDDLMADNDEQQAAFIKELQTSKETLSILISEAAANNSLQFEQAEQNNAARYELLTKTLNEVNTSIISTLVEIQADSTAQNTALMEALQNSHEELNSVLSDLSAENASYYESLAENLTVMSNSISSTLSAMQETSSEEHSVMLDTTLQSLKNVQAEITDILSELEAASADHYAALDQSIGQLSSDLQSVNAELSSKIDELESTADSNAQTLLQSMQSGHDSITASLTEMDHSNSARFAALDQALSDLSDKLQMTGDTISDTLVQMQESGKNQGDSILEAIQSSGESIRSMLSALESLGEEWYNDTNTNVDTKVTQLMNNLDSIHNNITSSQLDIKQMLINMSSADAGRMEQLLEKFYEITVDLANINTDMDTAHEEIQRLITEVQTNLQNTADENQSELLTTLSNMDRSFSQTNTEGFSNLLESLQSQAVSMKSQFDQLNESLASNVSGINQNVTSSKTEMLQKLEAMETTISSTVNNIGSGTSVSQEAILNRINQLEENTNNRLSGLSGDIQSVFQRVSNGKALLASALLTKDVVIDKDATFQEIHDAILSIDQEIVIGVDQIPGTIEYEYHHHTGSPESGGGCYTVEDVHRHNASCYQLCTYSWTGCEGSNGWTDSDSISHCNYRETHSICNNGQTMYKVYSHYNGGGSASGHRDGGSSTHAISICGKTEGQHYGWTTGCGLQDGQIIGAHIVYDAAAVSAAAAADYRQQTQSNAIFDLQEYLDSIRPNDMNGNESTVHIPEILPEESEPETENVSEATEGSDDETSSEEPDKTVTESEESSTEETETESETASMEEMETESETASMEGTEAESESASTEETETESETISEEESPEQSSEGPVPGSSSGSERIPETSSAAS